MQNVEYRNSCNTFWNSNNVPFQLEELGVLQLLLIFYAQ